MSEFFELNRKIKLFHRIAIKFWNFHPRNTLMHLPHHWNIWTCCFWHLVCHWKDMCTEQIYPGIYFIESNTDVFIFDTFWVMVSLIPSHPPSWNFFLILVYLQRCLIMYILLFLCFSCCSWSPVSIHEVVDLWLIWTHISWLKPDFKGILSNFSGNSAFLCLFLSSKFFWHPLFFTILIHIYTHLVQWMPLTWSLMVDHLSLKLIISSLQQSPTSKLIPSIHASPYCSSSSWSRPIYSSWISNTSDLVWRSVSWRNFIFVRVPLSVISTFICWIFFVISPFLPALFLLKVWIMSVLVCSWSWDAYHFDCQMASLGLNWYWVSSPCWICPVQPLTLNYFQNSMFPLLGKSQ